MLMQRKAWVYTMLATLSGAISLLARWLQLESAFDAETGMMAPHALFSYLTVFMLILTLVALWVFSGRIDVSASPVEPEEALAKPGKEIAFLLYVVGAFALIGALLLFFQADSTLLVVAALLGVLAAPCLALLLHLPKWGGFGAFLSVVPVVFLCVWLVSFYKDNSADPVVWKYCTQVLAIAGCLLATFRVAGYLFYRSAPRKAIFACGAALALCLTVIMDDAAIGARILYVSWGVGMGAIGWLLIRNLPEPDNTDTEEF